MDIVLSQTTAVGVNDIATFDCRADAEQQGQHDLAGLGCTRPHTNILLYAFACVADLLRAYLVRSTEYGWTGGS